MWNKGILALLSGVLETIPPPAMIVPRSRDLLGLCQGDCQFFPCRSGFVCYTREAGEPVPGCVMTADLLETDHAFCVADVIENFDDDNSVTDDDRMDDDSATAETIEPTEQQQESDAPSDVPSDVPSTTPTQVPTRVATLMPTRVASQAPQLNTVVTTTAPSVTRVVGQTLFPTVGQVNVPSLPEGVCKAGCFVDTDCAAGLICYQRTTNRGVPYCVMNQEQTDRRDNYCIPDPNVPTNLNYGGVVATVGIPGQLTECQAGCFTDVDCPEGLVCYQRAVFDGAPGCSLNPEILASDAEICLKNPTAYLQGNGNIPQDPSVFALKLYWEVGFDWQFESFERLYCLNCAGNCEAGAQMAVTNCFDSPRMWTLADLGEDGSALIKLNEFDLCLHWAVDFVAPPVDARLQPCNGTDDSQRFWPSQGSFDDMRFEISPRSRRGLCLTQEHHPLTNEIVYFDYCIRPQLSNTSYWNKFYPA